MLLLQHRRAIHALSKIVFVPVCSAPELALACCVGTCEFQVCVLMSSVVLCNFESNINIRLSQNTKMAHLRFRSLLSFTVICSGFFCSVADNDLSANTAIKLIIKFTGCKSNLEVIVLHSNN